MGGKGQVRQLVRVERALDDEGRDGEVARWLAPRVAWQRRLLELSRSAEKALQPAGSLQVAAAGPSGASITPMHRRSASGGRNRSSVTGAFERVARALGLGHPAGDEERAA
jgi:hypothetical protein